MAPLPAGIYRLLSVRPGLYRLHDLYRGLVAPKPHTNGVDRGCDLYYVELAGCDDAVGAADLGPYLQRSTRRPAHGCLHDRAGCGRGAAAARTQLGGRVVVGREIGRAHV